MAKRFFVTSVAARKSWVVRLWVLAGFVGVWGLTCGSWSPRAALGGSGSAKTTPAPSSHAALLSTVEDITRRVVALRGLSQKAPFSRGVLNRQQIMERLKERIHIDYSPDEVRQEALVLKRMGFLPPDADYEKLLFDLLSEQVAGFYDPYRKTLYVADWLPAEMQKPALAHEIQHALQDQHFDLRKLASPLKNEGDKQLARAALIEGDGTAVMMEFAARNMGVDSAQLPMVLAKLGRQMIQLSTSATPSLQRAPAILRESLMFPYAAGLDFVAAIRNGPGYARVDAAFLKPPVSTEQVLHPEKYLADEKPVRFVPSVLKTLPTYKEQRRDVLGELLWKVWFGRAMPEKEAEAAAAGWGGDVLFSLSQPGETLPLVLVLSGWDSAQDADEAELASQKLLLNLTQKSGDKLPGPGKLLLFERSLGDRTFAVARKDNRLLMICGAPTKNLAPVAEEVFLNWNVAP